MKKLKEQLKYAKRGITLISLVITIIVLLILAGVTIATLFGDNGILTQANNAKEKNEEASVKEEVELWLQEYQMDLYKSNNHLTLEQFLEQKKCSNVLRYGNNRLYI